MSTKKTQPLTEDTDSDEEAAQDREYIQSETVRMFKAEWYQAEPLKERARVMLNSECASNDNVSELHMFTACHSWAERHEWPKSQLEDYKRGILAHFIKLMASDDAPQRLEMLAKLAKRFPASQPAPNFNNWWSGPDWFKPTRQEGLKPIMLGAFFALMKKRPAKPLPTSLPTIGELDSAIRVKWKWSGGDKELRKARHQLGLSGLPRGKSGRPKKQRGK